MLNPKIIPFLLLEVMFKRYLLPTCCLIVVLSILQILQYVPYVKIQKLSYTLLILDPPRFDYIMNEQCLCDEKEGEELVLLVVIYLGANDTVERDFIRSTRGAVAKTHPKIRLFFMLGSTAYSPETTKKLNRESSQFHDSFIQGDLEEKYRNLAAKSIAAFQWAVRYCKKVKYVLKIDSDMRIDLLQLLKVLQTQDLLDKLLCGIMPHKTVHANRNKESKSYVSKKIYPSKSYPLFCNGAAYIIPRRILERYALSSFPKTLFPLDDVSITGILRKQLRVDIHKGFFKYYHNYKKTKTILNNGKYIMDVTVIGYKRKDVKKKEIK